MPSFFSSLMLSLFFISACAMVADEHVPQTPETVMAPTPEAENVSGLSAPTEPAGEDKQLTAAGKTPTKEEIRLFQAQLKAIGFDPGPLDGMAGLKTRSALNWLQSGCANLKDVVENLDAGVFHQQTGTQMAKTNAAAAKVPSNEAVRLLQVRLKDSGFDAGPIDGVLGLRTQSALLRLQSGCTLLKDLPWTLDSNFSTAERTVLSQSHMDISRLRPIADDRNEPDRVITADSRIPSKEEIQVIQGRLKDAGFDPGPIDGVLGPKTRWALQQYRSSYGTMNARKLSSGIGLKLDH
jgi:peptidoglycan hydrolase-like protein with peptidoglycan-binding domain